MTISSPRILTAVALATFALAAIFGFNRYVNAGNRNCVHSNNNRCATCEDTGDVYYCSPGEMPNGFDYGSCSEVSGDCYRQQSFSCGDFTFYCSSPGTQIPNDSICKIHLPPICAKVQPQPPPGGTG